MRILMWVFNMLGVAALFYAYEYWRYYNMLVEAFYTIATFVPVIAIFALANYFKRKYIKNKGDK